MTKPVSLEKRAAILKHMGVGDCKKDIELIDEFNLPISQAALSKRLIKLGMT
jgi:hypothetical protein